MEVVIDSIGRVRLDPKDALGDGGEATVIRHKTLAVKVYHKPEGKRTEKLQAMIVNITPKLPVNVVAPTELVYNSRHNEVVGFTMRALDKGYEVLASLSKRNFRTVSKTGAKFVSTLFLDAYDSLTSIHKADACVGDFNDLNELFLLSRPSIAFIDADSFQIPGYACGVATETFLDPQLFGPDLSAPVATKGGKARTFKPENDWYSFAVLLFKALTLVHPYGGVDSSLPTIPRRAAAKRSVYASGVKYPSKVAYSLEVLSPTLEAVMRSVFDGGHRGVFPRDAITEYLAQLTTCKTCGMDYPHQRAKCPSCSAIAPKVSVALTNGTTVSSLGHTSNDPVFAIWALGHRMRYVTHDYVHNILGPRGWQDPLPTALNPRELVDVSHKFLAYISRSSGEMVVCVGPATSTQTAFDKVLHLSTERFGTSRLAFGVSQDHYYRIAAGMLMRGDKDGSEVTVTQVMSGQTWFKVSKDPIDGADFLVGCERIFGQRRYWILLGSRRIDLDESLFALPDGSAIVDETVTFSKQAAVILRRVLSGGAEYVYTTCVDIRGNVVANYHEPSSTRIGGNVIHGSALGGKSLLVATDRGITRERFGGPTDPAPADTTTFTATEPYVGDAALIEPFEDGLAVAHDGQLRLLKLT